MEKESLYYLVRDTVATYAERPVYWVKPDGQNFHAVSYFNWRADMKRWSAYLLYKLNLKHGEPVGLICDNRYEWNMICMGIDTIGGIDVPRGCDATKEDIKYILNHTECAVVVAENEKMIRQLAEQLADLPHVKHIIAIEPASKFKKLEQIKEKLGKVKLHFFLDTLTIGEELLEQHGEGLLKKRGEAIRPHDIATIIYTSGTTGAPKGVMLEHRSFCWEVSQVQQTLPLNERDRVVVFLPPWHIAERVLEVTLMACGSSMAPSSIIHLAGDLGTIKPTAVVSVPRVWEGLYKRVFDNVRKQDEKTQKIFNFAKDTALTYTDIVDHLLDRFAVTEDEKPRARFVRKTISVLLFIPFFVLNAVAQIILKKVRNVLGGRVQYAISGAGAIPEHVATFFRAVGIPILDGYGMTETTALSVVGELPWPKRGAVGKPLPGVQIQLRDETGRVVTRPGARGVLWHKGPHVMRGYYKEPGKTADVLQDGWLNSGDIFTWTTTGELKFAGRAKDTIVLAGGENVEPGPIEIKLQESEFINQAVVVGQDRKTLGAILVPNWDRAREELKARGIAAPEDPAAWHENREIHEFYHQIIKEKVSGASGFKGFERVTTFHLLHKELEKGVEMTETMKVKRNVVFDKFENEIHHMYKE
ncbi:MAG: AMP-binding protein [Leptospiraceae bacterium]|nr:AMP-binding protein [Leptospiraceae bacterium]MCB1314403.1 AMP-binding protein [Leptospiraceae bacterium]MCB1320823.1 AMP-binding protein [Leptospiraceae bacterium]